MNWATRLSVSALTVVCVLSVAHAASPARTSGEPAAPSGLTSQGRLLRNFEALLQKTFGRRQPICVSGDRKVRTSLDFTAGECAPLAKYLLYWYTFQAPHGTTFHISGRRAGSLSFGNYPVAVLIRGHMVACDARERHFLIDYTSGAGLMLGCLTPELK